METLLSLTSRRAGEWFKEELRELGGLEHIVKTIRDCHRHINVNEISRGWCDPILDKLRKVDRCLRVLENVSYSSFLFLVSLLFKSVYIILLLFFKYFSFSFRINKIFLVHNLFYRFFI